MNDEHPLKSSGMLSIVATPIGNMEDITLRALRTLKECDAILAEDTRHSRILCRHHGIDQPLVSFHAHSPESKVDQLVEQLCTGTHLALISDAGTPLISDPGARLVRAAAAAGVVVQTLPGPSAAIAAIAVSGLKLGNFQFLGFLPRSGGNRRRAIEEISRYQGATVIYESPRRTAQTIEDLAAILGADRPAALCRELTKLYEETRRGTLAELAQSCESRPIRGEVTLVIEGAGHQASTPVDAPGLEEHCRRLLAEGMRTKDAAKVLVKTHSIPRKRAYAVLVSLAQEAPAGREDEEEQNEKDRDENEPAP